MDEILVASGRNELKDQHFVKDVGRSSYSNTLFTRLVAKEKNFHRVDFKYCIFDASYLRDCGFTDCDFTGCRFINSNLIGSSFSGCRFDYSSFQNTQIDNDILDSNCPSWENLKLKFARSLRLNYQQLGDAKSANKAMNVELAATAEHHRKSWSSRESYYRKKYTGMKRLTAFWHWFEFKTLDFIWGNGESLIKLTRAFLICLAIIAILHTACESDPSLVCNYLLGLGEAPSIFFGVTKPANFPTYLITLIYVVRLILFAFFMAIMIKRFGRR